MFASFDANSKLVLISSILLAILRPYLDVLLLGKICVGVSYEKDKTFINFSGFISINICF